MKYFCATLAIMLVAMPVVSEETTTTTAACKDGTDEFCGSCVLEKCAVCYNAFAADTGVCTEVTTLLDDCWSYSSATACSACEPGKKVVSGKCEEDTTTVTEPTITNCLTEVDSKCTVCDNGLPDADGKCPGTTACTVTNCKGCVKNGDAAETCAICNDDFWVGKDGKCVDSSADAYAGCLTINTTDDSCLVCKYGYYVKTLSPMKCEKSSRYESVSVIKMVFVALMGLFLF